VTRYKQHFVVHEPLHQTLINTSHFMERALVSYIPNLRFHVFPVYLGSHSRDLLQIQYLTFMWPCIVTYFF